MASTSVDVVYQFASQSDCSLPPLLSQDLITRSNEKGRVSLPSISEVLSSTKFIDGGLPGTGPPTFRRDPAPRPTADLQLCPHTAYDMLPLTARDLPTSPIPRNKVNPGPELKEAATDCYKCAHPGCTSSPFRTRHFLW